ncbi:hypothetical protein BP6252_12457 [Coleophoma cylindrospora]|uniref:C2H2-type domain-containing protein n=1 Tax=Coleophoma cylindrospora TaxID=1849047 RepID=A0A3D8QI38_9HELO|nr:hypothetical protein BP6252_12457 [Coleophoma cylindrospora]
MSLLPTFDTLNDTSLMSIGDVLQSPGLVGSSTAAPDPNPSIDPIETLVLHTTTNTEQPTRFRCVVNGCNRDYKRKHELKRHQKYHSGVKAHRCNIPRCNRSGQNGFVRRDHLGQHMKKVHKIDVL